MTYFTIDNLCLPLFALNPQNDHGHDGFDFVLVCNSTCCILATVLCFVSACTFFVFSQKVFSHFGTQIAFIMEIISEFL